MERAPTGIKICALCGNKLNIQSYKKESALVCVCMCVKSTAYSPTIIINLKFYIISRSPQKIKQLFAGCTTPVHSSDTFPNLYIKSSDQQLLRVQYHLVASQTPLTYAPLLISRCLFYPCILWAPSIHRPINKHRSSPRNLPPNHHHHHFQIGMAIGALLVQFSGRRTNQTINSSD